MGKHRINVTTSVTNTVEKMWKADLLFEEMIKQPNWYLKQQNYYH